MVEWTEEKINKIINLKGNDGKLIDIFNLHGVLFVGNPEDGKWDLKRTYTMYSEHRLGISLKDFEDCENENDVNNKFGEILEEVVKEKLL